MKETMRWGWHVGLGLLAALAGGCMSLPKQLPADYFEPVRSMSIRVVDCAPRPSLSTDQPAGHVASATWLVREQAMQNRMKGITPDMIRQAVEQELSRQLPPTFDIVTENPQLALEVRISEWGWSVPTGKLGESLAGHSFRIRGTASIYDTARGRERVYFTYNGTDTLMGDHLTAEKCEATLPLAAADFAAQIARFILEGKTP